MKLVGDDNEEIGSLVFDKKVLINSIVDHTRVNEILSMIHTRLLENAQRSGTPQQQKMHQTELRDFMVKMNLD